MAAIDATWEQRHTLADGTSLLLRPLRPGDAEALREGYEQLSSSSRYRRFLGSMPALSDEMLAYLTRVDGDAHVAIVAALESPDLKTERGIGVGRFVRLPGEPTVAEAALTVSDSFHGRGVGKLLLSALVLIAADHGIRNFRAEVLADNTAVLALLASVGAVERPAPAGEDGLRAFDIPIPGAGEGGEPRWQALYVLLRHAAVSVSQVFRQWWDVRP
ncbi:MAG: N-acetyltransferase [Myxococcales bacterium]|nr:MAG: N-acetyltransferase [Myxococcales bacterium]